MFQNNDNIIFLSDVFISFSMLWFKIQSDDATFLNAHTNAAFCLSYCILRVKRTTALLSGQFSVIQKIVQ